MYGNNPIRKPLKGDGNTLEVKHLFPTLQGEGPFVGMPSVFVRLGGCNLACSFCDTDFEDYDTRDTEAVIADVKQLSEEGGKRVRHLVVITGGEPLRQPLRLMTDRLLEEGFQIQIETNGTLYQELDKRVHIICSPKNTSGSYAPVRDDLLARADALKFIISCTMQGYTDIAEVGQSTYNTPVYVQPMDEGDAAKNAQNLAFTAELAVQHGYRLSMQIHKILGIE